MSSRPLPPPEVLHDDPGPWSVVSSVFSHAGRPGKRRPQPPVGLMLSPPPETALALGGLEPASPVAGLGRVRVVAAAREPALHLAFDDGPVLRGVSPYVVRTWSVPDLGPVGSLIRWPARRTVVGCSGEPSGVNASISTL